MLEGTLSPRANVPTVYATSLSTSLSVAEKPERWRMRPIQMAAAMSISEAVPTHKDAVSSHLRFLSVTTVQLPDRTIVAASAALNTHRARARTQAARATGLFCVMR